MLRLRPRTAGRGRRWWPRDRRFHVVCANTRKSELNELLVLPDWSAREHVPPCCCDLSAFVNGNVTDLSRAREQDAGGACGDLCSQDRLYRRSLFRSDTSTRRQRTSLIRTEGSGREGREYADTPTETVCRSRWCDMRARSHAWAHASDEPAARTVGGSEILKSRAAHKESA